MPPCACPLPKLYSIVKLQYQRFSLSYSSIPYLSKSSSFGTQNNSCHSIITSLPLQSFKSHTSFPPSQDSSKSIKNTNHALSQPLHLPAFIHAVFPDIQFIKSFHRYKRSRGRPLNGRGEKTKLVTSLARSLRDAIYLLLLSFPSFLSSLATKQHKNTGMKGKAENVTVAAARRDISLSCFPFFRFPLIVQLFRF